MKMSAARISTSIRREARRCSSSFSDIFMRVFLVMAAALLMIRVCVVRVCTTVKGTGVLACGGTSLFAMQPDPVIADRHDRLGHLLHASASPR